MGGEKTLCEITEGNGALTIQSFVTPVTPPVFDH